MPGTAWLELLLVVGRRECRREGRRCRAAALGFGADGLDHATGRQAPRPSAGDGRVGSPDDAIDAAGRRAASGAGRRRGATGSRCWLGVLVIAPLIALIAVLAVVAVVLIVYLVAIAAFIVLAVVAGPLHELLRGLAGR